MRFSKPKRSRTPELGALELEVLRQLWDCSESLDAHSVRIALSARPVSLSTVQATLERLHRKRFLNRTKIGRAYFYEAALSRERVIGSMIRDVAERLAEGELEPVISGFVDFVCDADPELLDELEARVATCRRDVE